MLHCNQSLTFGCHGDRTVSPHLWMVAGYLFSGRTFHEYDRSRNKINLFTAVSFEAPVDRCILHYENLTSKNQSKICIAPLQEATSEVIEFD